MKKFVALVLVCSLVFTLSACGDKTPDTPTQTEQYILPTTIIDADISLPYTSADSFKPYEAKSNFNKDLMTVLYESLYVQSGDGMGKRVLASSETVTDNTVTVKLLGGVNFTNGTVLTANHVKSSYELASSNEYFKASLSNISSVSVIDNNTISFQLINSDPMVLNTLCFPIVCASGDDYVGSGKYYIDYLEGVPYLAVNTSHREYNAAWNKQIALYDMAGISSPIYPFKANEISIYRNDLSSGEYTNLSSVTVSEQMNNLVYIGLNSNWAGTVVSNDWFRQVLNIGLNRTSVASMSFLGQTDAISTFYREEFYMLENVERPSLDGDTLSAIAILEENGYSSFNGEGVRTNGSNSLNISILVCNMNPYKVGVAESVKKSLEALGIGVTIRETETMEDYVAALEEGFFDLYIGETQLTSNYLLDEFFSAEGALNYGISEELYTTYDAYKRGDVGITEFVASCNESVPVVPLFYRRSIVSINPNVTGADSSSSAYSGVCNWILE